MCVWWIRSALKISWCSDSMKTSDVPIPLLCHSCSYSRKVTAMARITFTPPNSMKPKARRDTLFSTFLFRMWKSFPKAHNILLIHYWPEVVHILITEPFLRLTLSQGWWWKRGTGMDRKTEGCFYKAGNDCRVDN